MNRPDPTDPVWELAWEWVVREHEESLDEGRRQQLMTWLQADIKHRAAYEDACEIWLAAALIPRVDGDDSDTGDGPPDRPPSAGHGTPDE